MFTKKNIDVILKFLQKHLDVAPGFWRTAILTEKSKVELWCLPGYHCFWQGAYIAFCNKNLVSIVRHRGDGITLWECGVVSGSGQLAVTEGEKKNSTGKL